MGDFALPIPTIRRATPNDAAELARLLTALGHPTTADDVVARWPEWTAAGNVALVDAHANGSLSGVATLGRMVVLHRPHPVSRITALIVDAPARGAGFGRALVAAAEETLARAGCGLLEITSNMRLSDAHSFYEHLDHQRTSIRLVNDLLSAR